MRGAGVTGKGGQLPVAQMLRRIWSAIVNGHGLIVPSGFPGAEIGFTAYGERPPSPASWSLAGPVPPASDLLLGRPRALWVGQAIRRLNW